MSTAKVAITIEENLLSKLWQKRVYSSEELDLIVEGLNEIIGG